MIRGGVAHWGAVGRWSAAYLRQRCGSRRILCYLLRNGDVIEDGRTGVLKKEITVSEYLESEAEGGTPKYRLRASLLHELPELLEDVEIPAFCRDGMDLKANIWAGEQGSYTRLHWDMPPNLVGQVSGRKRFVLFSPRQSRCMYPHSVFSPTPQYCHVNLARPDYDAFPRLRQARPTECVLEPGDLLYLPSRWWHWTEGVTRSISVNFWWAPWTMLPIVLASRAYRLVRRLEY